MRFPFSIILSMIFMAPSQGFAEKGAEALIDKVGAEDVLKGRTSVVRKELKLDDPYLIQLYGSWKAQRNSSPELDSWMELVFAKDFEEAFRNPPSQSSIMLSSAMLYLMHRIGLNQTFLDQWLRLSSSTDFINTELSMALDQIVSKSGSEWFFQNGIRLTEIQQKRLAGIPENSTRFYQLARAWDSQRKGNAAEEYLSLLPPSDPLSISLAKTAVIQYAREGELAKAASILKNIYEPGMENVEDMEALSDYYMMLARLLYQANAFKESKHYYELIPEESANFLSARSERSWILLQEGDLSSVKGEVHSFNFSPLEDKFYPEVYWFGSIARLKLCQFEGVQKTFAKFIENNRVWARRIEKNLASDNPEPATKNDFHVLHLNRGIAQAKKEIEILKRMEKSPLALEKRVAAYKRMAKEETLRGWKNKKKILENTIHKMRFVKVEFISMMRRLKDKLYRHKTNDSIRTSLAGTLKGDQMLFPYDGMEWGDELFQLRGELSDLCLKETNL